MTVLNPQAATRAERGFHPGGAGAPAHAISPTSPTLIFFTASLVASHRHGSALCGEVSGQLGSLGLVNFEPQTSRSNLKVSLGTIRKLSDGRLAMRHLSRNHQVASK